MGVRMLFGAVGLVIALLTALGMNALFDALNTRALLAGTRVLLFDTEDEVVERLQEAGAQFGDPQFSLAWNNRNDLDLHVIDPAGNHIWYRQRSSPTGGELDVDANADRLRTTERPVENIYWPPANAPEGVYKVYVHHYANHGAPDPTPYTLRITIGGRTREFQGSLRHGEREPGDEYRPARGGGLVSAACGADELGVCGDGRVGRGVGACAGVGAAPAASVFHTARGV
jgi:hypothetical protein